MGIVDDLAGVLKQYQTGATQPPATEIPGHFDQVAAGAPRGALAAGIAQALGSNQTPPLAQIVSTLFSQANPGQKAAMLNQMLAAMGPSAAATAPGSALASYIGGGMTISPEQAQQVPPEMVSQLAQHAQSSDVNVVDKLSAFYSQHPTLVKGLGVAAMAIIISHIANRR